ncbi:MAG: hypothetical protein WDN67_05325 [Candidatus Moraniibacteriota bacterium]
MKLSFPESPQKRLVLLFCIVFLALGTLLTREAYVLSNPASHPWAAEFVSPTSFDLAFRVSNLVKTEEFHFVLSNEQGETLSEGTVRFDPADRKAILPEEGLDAKRLSGNSSLPFPMHKERAELFTKYSPNLWLLSEKVFSFSSVRNFSSIFPAIWCSSGPDGSLGRQNTVVLRSSSRSPSCLRIW